MNIGVYKRYMDAKKYNEKKKQIDGTIADTIKVLKGYTKDSVDEQFVAEVAINALTDLARLRAKQSSQDKGMDK